MESQQDQILKILIQKIEWKRINKTLKKRKKKKKFFFFRYKKNLWIMEKRNKYNINIINDVSGLKYDKKSINVLKKIIFLLLFIICKVIQICKKNQNIKMFY